MVAILGIVAHPFQDSVDSRLRRRNPGVLIGQTDPA